jgi:hypothetical protein
VTIAPVRLFITRGVSIKCGSTFWENWDNARRGCKRRALVGGG